MSRTSVRAVAHVQTDSGVPGTGTGGPGPGSHLDEIGGPEVEAVLEVMRSRGSRLTRCRRLLVSRLVAAESHRTAEDLAREVQSLDPDVHMSTIYRNLEELERLGVAVHTHLGHGPAVYHLASQSHAHLVCRHCGSSLEAPDELLAGLAEAVGRQYGFRLDPHHFALLGTCSACGLDAMGGPAEAGPSVDAELLGGQDAAG